MLIDYLRMKVVEQFDTAAMKSDYENELKRAIARLIAASINESIRKSTDCGKVPISSIHTSLGTHLVIEGVATALEVDRLWFKKECGVGQPLAYFI